MNDRRAILARQLRHAATGNPDGCDLRIEIAERDIGQADIFADDVQDFIGEHIGTDDLHARQAQAFLEHRCRIGSKAARNRSADIEIMGDVDGIGQDFSIDEERLDDCKIAGMGAARIGIVGEQDVAIGEIAAEFFNQRFHLHAERAGKQRDAVHLGNKFAFCCKETTGKIEHFIDDRAHAGAGHDNAHLIDGRHQLALDDFLGHRIDPSLAGGHRLRTLLAPMEGRLGVFGAHR